MTLIHEGALTAIEQTELQTCEGVIERGLKTYYEVGSALLSIRDNRLYRLSYATFEDYCQQRWSMARAHAYRLIDAAEVKQNLSPIGDILPRTESQARPLSALSPDEQRAAWQEAVETAPNHQPTAAHVQRIVNQQRARVGSFDPDSDFEGAPFEEALDYVDPDTGEIIGAPMLVEEAPDSLLGRQKPKTNRAADSSQSLPYDSCQTPPYALEPLLPYLWTLHPHGLLWEPASGEGLLVDALHDNGFLNVLGSDILTGQSFFDYEPDVWDCIVTNPPYSDKYDWLTRAYTLGKPFALLLPVETLGAKTAQELFRVNGLEVIFMNQRVDFKMVNLGYDGSGAQFPVAWFTWGLNIGQQMTFANITDAKRRFLDGLA